MVLTSLMLRSLLGTFAAAAAATKTIARCVAVAAANVMVSRLDVP